MKIAAIIEARMSSSRLPGKVMKPILGRPVLELLIERLSAVKSIDEIVIAATTNKADDVLEDLGRKMGINCFRGSEADVLGRVLGAARSVNADLIVEITGDCPLIDPEITTACIKSFMDSDCDYLGNGCFKKTFPDGLAVQIFTTKIADEVNSLTNDAIDHEHPTLYIYSHPERFKLKGFFATGELCWPELAITLDTPQDYELIKIIFERLHPVNPLFGALDVVRFLRSNPELLKINEDEERRENYINGIPRNVKGTQ